MHMPSPLKLPFGCVETLRTTEGPAGTRGHKIIAGEQSTARNAVSRREKHPPKHSTHSQQCSPAARSATPSSTTRNHPLIRRRRRGNCSISTPSASATSGVGQEPAVLRRTLIGI